jgi:GNAT superfamily N-acetyltransferase
MDHVEIRPRTPDDDAEIIAILHAINHDRPPKTVEEYRHDLATIPADAGAESRVAEVAGHVVGIVDWQQRWYTTEKTSYGCYLSVHPSHWGQGIGSALYDLALRDIEARAARKVYATVREDLPNALQFASSRGFEQTGFGMRRSRLTVRDARLDRSRRAAERVRESGIRILSLTELNPDEDMLRAICDIDNASAMTTPSSEEWNPTPFEEWKRYVTSGPGYAPDAFFVALDGNRPIALSFLELRTGGHASNGYTGVHPDYQGRGIARALKLRTVEWAQANGIDYIGTGNDPNNKPMLAINQDLGYEFLPAMLEMVKSLAS